MSQGRQPDDSATSHSRLPDGSDVGIVPILQHDDDDARRVCRAAVGADHGCCDIVITLQHDSKKNVSADAVRSIHRAASDCGSRSVRTGRPGRRHGRAEANDDDCQFAHHHSAPWGVMSSSSAVPDGSSARASDQWS